MAAILGVLALSGLATAMASAATAGWKVNGTFLTGTKALATTAAVDEHGKLNAGQVEINCVASTLTGVSPQINGTTEHGDAQSLEFNECTGNSVCPLAASQKEKVKTLPVLVDLTLDGTLAVKGRFLSTNSSKLFATIAFEGAECSFKGTQPVKGAQTVLAPTGQDERTLQLLAATEEEPGALTLGNTPATLKGSILVRLASGEPYSFS
jgi:hypothetical protein